jgi:pyridoxal phosphate enzyme (YggS family)
MKEAESTEIRAQLAALRERIDAACRAAGRSPDEVRLLLASKTQPPERIREAASAGATLFGENRVQELARKAPELEGLPIEWHMIGHLQTNKVRQVLDWVRVIQSVDRLSLVEALERELEKRDGRVKVYLQVNTSGEESKSGVRPEEAESLARAIVRSGRLELEGLMTIATNSPDPEDARRCFRLLREVRDRLVEQGIGAPRELSMGMSGDLEVAIEEGSTLLRVGSAVFGERG